MDVPPKWIPNSASDSCYDCATLFTLTTRRHHCRRCGKLVCGTCSKYKHSLPSEGSQVPVRVCKECHEQLAQEVSENEVNMWVPDSASEFCYDCQIKFTFTNRRHHCRSCGKLICHQCSSSRAKLEIEEHKIITFNPGNIGMTMQSDSVTNVSVGCQAGISGVRTGWRVVALNDSPIVNKQEVELAIAKLKDGNVQFNIHFAMPKKKEFKFNRFKPTQISKDPIVRICSYCSEQLKTENVNIVTGKKLKNEDTQDISKEKKK